MALVALDALVVEPRLRLTVSRVPLPAGHEGRLARSLAGTRVMHLSDLHVRGLGFRERRLMRLIAAERPDLILMTGDYGEGRAGLEALSRVLGAWKPPLGAFGVFGNNDYFRGEQAAIARALETAGVRLLVNASARIDGPGGTVYVAGVDDPHFGRDRLEEAMAGVPDGAPLILLAHSPDLLAAGRGRGVLINAGDERGPWGSGWFWNDGAHMIAGTGEVLFGASGRHRLRVQRREDGVAVEEIRLVPQGPSDGPPRRRGGRDAGPPEHRRGEIVVTAADVADADLHGGWVRRRQDGRELLVDTPDDGVLQAYPEVSPVSYFETDFEAAGHVRYHVWVHFRSGNGWGTSDSLYLQFTDSLGPDGAPAWRTGEEAPPVDTARVDLMLAGHTHGGQVVLPLLGPVEPNVRHGRYLSGSYAVDGMSLYVSRGVGWSYLPVRFFCPPEAVVMTAPEQRAEE